MQRWRIIFYCLFFFVQVNAQHNVILIIADDLGSDYCGFYENHLDTVAMPHIRSLLSKGVRFSNAWSNPLCSPTRAGMLTGRYSFRTGVGDAVGGAGSATLDTSEITIPRLFQLFSPGGISKANIGKWHLHLPNPVSNYFFPNVMGYDYFSGNFSGSLPSYYSWNKITNGISNPVTNYATIETSNDAIAWIKNQGTKPFFLWLAYNAPHTPYHLPPPGMYSDASLSGADADITANPKGYFKAAVEALDMEIGRVLDSLEVLQKLDSTDIIFIGDNGDDPKVAQGSPAKGSIYEAGIRVPFIISGPSIVDPNRVSDALVNTQDLFATILELEGFSDWQSYIPVNKPVDSKSLMPVILNQATQVRPWAFSEVFKNPTVSGDGKTMRNMDYKLLNFDNGIQKFFHLSIDPEESNNLLSGALTPEEQTNFNYLCNEMTNLVGNGDFCNPTVGLHDVGSRQNVPVYYPNPFWDHISVMPVSADNNFEIFDSLSQLIFSGKHIELHNFSMLPRGLYFIKTTGSSTAAFTKILKE